MTPVKPIPDGYPRLTPTLIVAGGEKAIEFYVSVFRARERMRIPGPGGTVAHAELELGESLVMLADEHPAWGARAPGHFGGSPVTLSLYVEDVDATVAEAVAAGAELLGPVANQFYGDRSGRLRDPFGHVWVVATHVEDVPEDELQRRAAAFASSG